MNVTNWAAPLVRPFTALQDLRKRAFSIFQSCCNDLCPVDDMDRLAMEMHPYDGVYRAAVK
jgi:hypothetical protein